MWYGIYNLYIQKISPLLPMITHFLHNCKTWHYWFALICCCLFSFSVSAQYSKKAKENYSSRYGLKTSAGIIVTRPEITYLGNEQDQIVHEINLKNASPQLALGLWGQKRFGWIYSEANLSFSTYGMNFNVASFSTAGQSIQTMSEKFGYFDMQIMGGLLSNGFRIGVGPSMHILTYHDSELIVLQNYFQKLRDVSYGFSGTIGYDWERFSFDFRYDKAFRTVGDHIYYGNKKSLFLETPDAITLSVAYAFFN